MIELRTISLEESTERLIDYRGKTPPKTSSGVRLITAKVVKDGQVLEQPEEFIAGDFYDKWMRRGLPQAWDVLITTEAPLGEVAILRDDKKIALAQRIILLRPDRKVIDPLFMFYALQSEFAQAGLRARASGTTVPGIRQTELRRVEIPYFPLPVQRRVAKVLSAYDDLIENNQRRIRILEEMARSLYREWFVHFRFPGHENTPRVASSLGEIPRGWAVKRLGDVIELAYGKALKAEDRRGGPVPVYGSSGVVGAHDIPLAKGPGIIVGRKGNVGSIAWSDTSFFVIDTAFYVKSQLPMRFLYQTLQGKSFLNGDAAVPGLKREQAYSLEQLVPPMEILNRFALHAEKLGQLATVLAKQVDNLRRTRDLLLPRLLSGQLKLEAN